MESNQGRPRGILHGAIYLRNKWWKEAFTDYDLDPPKPRIELVTRQGNRAYVVQVDPRAPPPRANAGGWKSAVGRHQGRAATHLHQGAVAVDETAESQPAGHITTRGNGNGTKRRWSRGVGARDEPNDEPHPQHGSRAGDCPPSARRVAGPSQ
jgi:hypothetical protein